MTVTGYKAVTAALQSPWVRNADRITYVVGDTFTAAHGGTHGIAVLDDLDTAIQRAALVGMNRGDGPPRFLEVSYDSGDVTATQFGYGVTETSVSQVTVTADVTP